MLKNISYLMVMAALCLATFACSKQETPQEIVKTQEEAPAPLKNLLSAQEQNVEKAVNNITQNAQNSLGDVKKSVSDVVGSGTDLVNEANDNLKTQADSLLGSLQKKVESNIPAAEKLSGTLYERLGGSAAVTAVVDDFVARTAANPQGQRT